MMVRIFDSNNIGPAVWTQHDRLQPTAYSCRDAIEIRETIEGVSLAQLHYDTGADHSGGACQSYAFRIAGSVAVIHGVLFSAEAELFSAVADTIFAMYPAVSVIKSDASFPTLGERSSRLVAARTKNVDYLLQLPGDLESYDRQRDKEFITRLKYKVRRFFRQFPEADFRIFEGQDISEDIVHKIVELNRERTARKGGQRCIDASYEARILQLAQRQGVAGVLFNNREVCAGTILYRWGDSVILEVVAHSHLYDKHSPGLICIYLGIGHFIRTGIRSYHFLWGDSDYKTEFGALPETLVGHLILRSWKSWRLAVRDVISYRKKRLTVFAGQCLLELDKRLGQVLHHKKPLRPLTRWIHKVMS